jgi:hypothetical protein
LLHFGAAQLLVVAESTCRAAGLSQMRLATHVKMPQNVAIYGRLGWVEVSRDDRKIMMTKQL